MQENKCKRQLAMAKLQETVFLLSVIIMVMISIIMTRIYLGEIEIPDEFENSLKGSPEDIVPLFAGFIGKCYATHSNGEISEDCYILHINSTGTITRTDLVSVLKGDSFPVDILKFSSSSDILAKGGTQATYRIYYDSVSGQVQVKGVDRT